MKAIFPALAALALVSAPQLTSAAPVDDVIVVTGAQTEAAQASMHSVIDGDQLRARDVRDLRGALALVAGVDAPPGGDAGPAGAVPAFWGLQEFDAFLLVVDGVPAGGAFNPAVPTFDFLNIDRIEVTRGAAPVSYGVASFVGTIEVFHAAPGATQDNVSVWGGSRSRAGFDLTADLPNLGDVRHSLSVSGEQREFAQDRSDMSRAHALYRLAGETGWGAVGFDFDLTSLRQTPYSPHPREGAGLSTRFVFDANVNPTDTRQDQDRAQATLRLRHDLAANTDLLITASATHTEGDNTRGFLREGFATDGVTVNADGFRQNTEQDELYLDAQVESALSDALDVAFGVDLNLGRARQHSQNFEYAVLPNGANAPNSVALPVDEATALTDERNFGGVYAEAHWRPIEPLSIEAGLRYDFTDEERSGSETDFTVGPPVTTSGSDDRNENRLSGSIGMNYALWQSSEDSLSVFASYSDTFKPGAIDLGPEAETGILDPETAHAYQAGLRGLLFLGKLDWEVAAFDMTINNLIIRENIDGLPALANAGKERFRGYEAEAHYHPLAWLDIMASYAHHDAEFVDYARLRPDRSIQQLAGLQLELSPNDIAGRGCDPGHG